MDEVMSFSWANSPSMDMPFSEKAQGLRASPNGYPSIVLKKDTLMNDRVMGFDVYNMADTGLVSKTLNAVRSDSDHIPVVCILNNQGENDK